ncbi:hypothetical protein AaE_003363 [Aphanomyces astaci]|uniref:Reverse transcriptase Ty1/copia-type domain-containing protein n=1 Tax=Aphanomyces astaci TaxID=112090 RepID=A0A6A5AM59_APHAT|nr:hypothetical protein AaE_003363 [Aphanomyces astaci]
MLKDKVSKCRAAGCGDDFATALWALLFRYEDVFRLSLDRDPLANMAPLRVTLKAGAESVLCKARRYSKEQRDFMSKHVEELQAAGLCYRNPRTKWCSAPLIVKKPEGNDFRMTVDVRPVNAQTKRIIWPMHMLEAILDHLAGASVSESLCPQNDAERLSMVDKPYRSVVDSIMYLMISTRPDLAYVVQQLSQFLTNPGPVHWQAAKRALRYIRETIDYGLILGGAYDHCAPLHAYADSDYAYCVDTRRCVAGFVTFYRNSAISWIAKRMRASSSRQPRQNS